MKEKEELKKPDNYQEGGLDKIKSSFIRSLPQILCVLTILVWVVSSIYVSIKDILNGFEHTWLSYSFIVGIITIGYLTTTNFIAKKSSGTKPKVKKKPCKSCGKGGSKK